MRVDVVTPTFPPEEGGIATLADDYVSNSRHDITVITDVIGAEKFVGPDTDLRQLNSLSGMGGLVELYRFLRRRRGEADWVHFVHPKNAVAGYFSGVRYSVHAHGKELLQDDGVFKSQAAHWLVQTGLTHAEIVIAVSSWTEDRVARMGVNDVIVVHPGIPAERVLSSPGEASDRLRSRFGVPSESPLLLTIARLDDRKGHDIVISAMQQVDDCHYLICGRGKSRERLEELVRRLDVGDRVHFAGYVDEDEITEYYDACDVFVMPSKHLEGTGDVEGFGIVFLEANARGKPVIGSNTGGIPSAIRDGETGLIVRPNADDVAEAITKLVTDRQLRDRMGRAGIEWAQKHRVDETSERIDSIISERYRNG